ncbi:MAG: hypothetical protein AAF997_09860 [Myxococcota bacterium]
MQAARELSVGVAHEINNVLGVIVGNAHLAMKNVADAPALERYLAEIRNAAEEGREVMRQLSTIAGEDRARPRLVSLNDLAHQLTQGVDKAVELTPSEVEPRVELDLWLAQDALGSVAKFMASATSVTRLRVATRILGNAAMLTLEDDGPSPSDPELASVFSPFSRLGGRPKHGLDLTKLAYLAEQAHGHVSAGRVEPSGLRLVLTLPTRE